RTGRRRGPFGLGTEEVNPGRGVYWGRRQSRRATPLAAPAEIAAPAVFAKRRIDRRLLAKFDHQSKRFLHRRLLGRLAGSSLSSCHESVVDFDVCAHNAAFSFMCIEVEIIHIRTSASQRLSRHDGLTRGWRIRKGAQPGAADNSALRPWVWPAVNAFRGPAPSFP